MPAQADPTSRRRPASASAWFGGQSCCFAVETIGYAPDARLSRHDEALAEARTRVAETGATFLHPFDDPPHPFEAAEPLSNELPVDVALGKVDYIEVLGFSDHRTTADVWYRLLNLGVRLPAAAGTDAMANVRARIVVPSNLRVVTSGNEVSRRPVRERDGHVGDRVEITVHAGVIRDFALLAGATLQMASQVVGDTLVVPVENDSESFSAGLDVTTGATRWKRDRPKVASWASPVALAGGAGKPLVLLQSGPGLSVVDARTGAEAWYYTDGASTMSSSVFTDGILYVPTKGMAAMKPGAPGAHPEVLWQNNQLTPSTASPAVLDGKVFTLNNAGILSAADAKDGKRLWQLRTTGPYSATPIGFGKHLYLVNEKGLVQVVDTSAPEGAVVSKLDLADTIIGTPSIAGGAVYVRSDKALVKLGGS